MFQNLNPNSKPCTLNPKPHTTNPKAQPPTRKLQSRLSQKATKSGPASGRKPREADHFKCRKDLKVQDVENLKYVCTVTEYKMRRDAGQSSSKAGGDGYPKP